VLWTNGTREARVSLGEDAKIPHLDLAELAEQARTRSRREFTTLIERLMGEVSKRCKRQWMHGSTDGLRNILILVLVRYADEALYEGFKNACIHNEAFI